MQIFNSTGYGIFSCVEMEKGKSKHKVLFYHPNKFLTWTVEYTFFFVPQ